MIEGTPAAGLFRGLRRRMRDYRAVFTGPPSVTVMADLAKFCSFLDTTREHGGSIEDTMILEGRRQVFLRIIQHLKLTPEELFTLLNGLDEATRVALFDNRRPAPVAEEF